MTRMRGLRRNYPDIPDRSKKHLEDIMETRIDSYYFAGSYIGCRLYTDGQHAVTGEGEEGSKWVRRYCEEFGLKPTIFNRIDV